MSIPTALSQKLPEWYILEKETAKTISKLSGIRELEHYLRNPNEYIRRLAIIRSSELKLKDSITVLKDFLDDPLESAVNKELAAWAIKSAGSGWDIELYTGNKLLSRFSGREKYCDLFNISVKGFPDTIRFEFASMLLESELQSGGGEYRAGEGINLDTTFSLGEWLRSYSSDILHSTGNALLGIPLLLIKLIGKITGMFFRKLFSLALSLFLKLRSRRKLRYDKYEGKGVFSRDIYVERPNRLGLLKNGVHAFLRALFFPFRLVYRYRAAVFITVLIAYCFMAYSTYGRIFIRSRFGVDLAYIQEKALDASREVLRYAWEELKTLTGQDKARMVENGQETIDTITVVQSVQGKKFTVTAKTGLNLRYEPDSASGKVPGGILPGKAVVEYLGKSETDSGGRLWHHIKTPDGRTGWAYAKWLKELGGEQVAGS